METGTCRVARAFKMDQPVKTKEGETVGKVVGYEWGGSLRVSPGKGWVYYVKTDNGYLVFAEEALEACQP